MKTLIKLYIAVIFIFFSGMWFGQHIHHMLSLLSLFIGVFILVRSSE